MSEGGERTEKATPKKRKDAREKGQVRKSTEIVTAVMMLIMFGYLSLAGGDIWKAMCEAVENCFKTWAIAGNDGVTAGSIGNILLEATIVFIKASLPAMLVAFMAALVTNVVQVGFLFSTKALAPKMERLNPLKGLKRMFSLQTLFQLVKAIAKIIVIGVVAYSQYMNAVTKFGLMAGTNLMASVTAMGSIIVDAGFAIGFALLIIAAIDYVYQWFKYEKDLKMTKYEVKMEYKQLEGDPQIKGRIKQKQRQMATMRMMQAVPQADVVITNPTHYAIALKYDDTVAPAPIVVARGADALARRIKEIARESKVEIVENKPVARALYEMCGLNDQVPQELYQAVAEILAEVYKMKNRA